MDWFNTGFYMDFGYNLVYPQVLPHIKRSDADVQAATLELGASNSARWLTQLDEHWIGPERNYVCDDEISLADYFGWGLVSMGELIGQRLERYPNVTRWLETMNRLPASTEVNAAFDGWVASLDGQSFRSVA